jgi:hypothetical protein
MAFMERSLKIQLLASVIQNNNTLSQEEEEIFSEIMPISEFKNRYHCSAIDYLYINNSPFNEDVFKDDVYVKRFDSVINNVLLRNMPDVLADRVCMFSNLTGLATKKWEYRYSTTIAPNNSSLSQDGNMQLQKHFTGYLDWTSKQPQKIIFWSHFFYIFIYVIYFFKGIWQRNYLLLGYIAIVCVNIPVILVFSPARDFRYLYMVLLALPFLFLVDKIKLTHKKT